MKLDSLLKEYRDPLPNAPAIDFEALIHRESARKDSVRPLPGSGWLQRHVLPLSCSYL